MANSLGELLAADAGSALIIPGTTPTLRYTVKSELIQATKAIRLDITQDDVIVNQINNITIDGDTAVHTFTQDETYAFHEGVIQTQLHGITSENVAWKSKIVEIGVGKSLTNTPINKPYEG